MLVTTKFKKRGHDENTMAIDYSIGCTWIGENSPKIISFTTLVDDNDEIRIASKIEMTEKEVENLIKRLQGALAVTRP